MILIKRNASDDLHDLAGRIGEKIQSGDFAAAIGQKLQDASKQIDSLSGTTVDEEVAAAAVNATNVTAIPSETSDETKEIVERMLWGF